MFVISQYNPRLGREVVVLQPGEYLVSSDSALIATVLGSCVSVVLYDKLRKLGGMNHFMLPGSLSGKGLVTTAAGKYGMYAMELLIAGFIKRGSAIADLSAKVFGGGSVLDYKDSAGARVADSNIRFAFEYLQIENIPIIASDVGGGRGRKIYLDPTTFAVKLKRIGTDERIRRIEAHEKQYFARISSRDREGNAPVLFGQESPG